LFVPASFSSTEPTPRLFCVVLSKGRSIKTHKWDERRRKGKEKGKKKKKVLLLCTKIKHARMESGFFQTPPFVAKGRHSTRASCPRVGFVDGYTKRYYDQAIGMGLTRQD
jgi:hypothetical protein